MERREKRLEVFDTIFYQFRKTIDSFGIENLDAKPMRFLKTMKFTNLLMSGLPKKVLVVKNVH